MPNIEQTELSLDDILTHPFVVNLLKFVSDIRKVLGDEAGNLTNDEVVERARSAYQTSNQDS